MKTVTELSVETSIDRSTLLKAAQQERIPAHQSGSTWLIDEESEQFKIWLAGSRIGRPRRSFPETIMVETPEPPVWVTTEASKRAWHESLEWRCDAAKADTEYYQQHLLREADRMYNR